MEKRATIWDLLDYVEKNSNDKKLRKMSEDVREDFRTGNTMVVEIEEIAKEIMEEKDRDNWLSRSYDYSDDIGAEIYEEIQAIEEE